MAKTRTIWPTRKRVGVMGTTRLVCGNERRRTAIRIAKMPNGKTAFNCAALRSCPLRDREGVLKNDGGIGVLTLEKLLCGNGFASVEGRRVEAAFDSGPISSKAGALLGSADRRSG